MEVVNWDPHDGAYAVTKASVCFEDKFGEWCCVKGDVVEFAEEEDS